MMKLKKFQFKKKKTKLELTGLTRQTCKLSHETEITLYKTNQNKS
jgi:hypothetical protein